MWRGQLSEISFLLSLCGSWEQPDREHLYPASRLTCLESSQPWSPKPLPTYSSHCSRRWQLVYWLEILRASRIGASRHGRDRANVWEFEQMSHPDLQMPLPALASPWQRNKQKNLRNLPCKDGFIPNQMRPDNIWGEFSHRKQIQMANYVWTVCETDLPASSPSHHLMHVLVHAHTCAHRDLTVSPENPGFATFTPVRHHKRSKL